jgi:hypothetical protein
MGASGKISWSVATTRSAPPIWFKKSWTMATFIPMKPTIYPIVAKYFLKIFSVSFHQVAEMLFIDNNRTSLFVTFAPPP